MGDGASNLNGVYAAFGRITEGLDILEKIYNETEIAPKENTEEGVDTTESAIDRFNTYPKIKSATVDTHGIDYGNPVTEKAFDYSAYMYDLMSSYYNTNAEQ